MSHTKMVRRPLFERLQSGLEEGIRHMKGEINLRTTILPETPPQISPDDPTAFQEIDDPRPTVTSPASRYREILYIALIQYLAAGLGIAWGWGILRYAPMHSTESLWAFTGVAGMILLLAGCLQLAWIGRKEPRHRRASWICFILASIAAYIIVNEQLLWIGQESEVSLLFRANLSVLPFLLAVGPLVRSRALLALLGIVLFVTTSLAMIVHNGSISNGGSGFFESWIS